MITITAATDHEGPCQRCFQLIMAGDRITYHDDDTITHIECSHD